MDEQFGAEGGAVLRRCLTDIRVAGCLGEVPLLAMPQEPASFSGEVSVEIGAGMTVVLKANHQRPPSLKGGGIDWPRVDRILIQRIESEHG